MHGVLLRVHGKKEFGALERSYINGFAVFTFYEFFSLCFRKRITLCMKLRTLNKAKYKYACPKSLTSIESKSSDLAVGKLKKC